METGSSTVQESPPGRQGNDPWLSVLEALVTAGATVLVALVLAPLLTYAVSIAGTDVGLTHILAVTALLGAALSVVAQMRG